MVQFIVVGALVVAWGWMLGRPILVNLMRRSRRDSVGDFRYQQAMLSPPGELAGRGSGPALPRPFAAWRAQPLERRRLQLLMGFSLATFVSLLLAIALRGPFVRLLGVMAVLFVAYLCVAAYIGSVELRRAENERSKARLQSQSPLDDLSDADGAVSNTGLVSETGVVHDDRAPIEPAAELEDEFWAGSGFWDGESAERRNLFSDRGFGRGVFEDGFFDPIPELQHATQATDDAAIDEPVLSAEADDVADGTVDQADDGSAYDEAEVEVTFTTAPADRPRLPKRDKPRPIYIESQLDAERRDRRAVND